MRKQLMDIGIEAVRVCPAGHLWRQLAEAMIGELVESMHSMKQSGTAQVFLRLWRNRRRRFFVAHRRYCLC